MIDRPPAIKSPDQVVFDELGELMKVHLEQNPYLAIAEYDSEKPLHQLSTVKLDAEPVDPITTTALAELFQPGFEEVIKKSFLDNKELVYRVAETLKNGDNIALVTAHESLMDIILVSYGLNAALAEAGLVDYDEQIKATEIVLSRTIASLESGGVAAPEIIKQLGNLHFSLPLSDRIRNSSISEETCNANNRLMVGGLMRAMRVGRQDGRGHVVCIAAPGSVDIKEYSSSGELDSVYIKPVADVTAKLVKKAKYILPVAAVLSGEKQCCVPGELREFKDPLEIHQDMETIARVRHELTGVETVYAPIAL